MNITTAQKTKTGIFVFISLLLLIGLIFLIGKQKNLFRSTFLVYADFKNIAGIKEGNYVRFAGINIGSVETITIVNDTTVQLALNIDEKIRKYIKTNAVASVGSDGLMGDKLVLIAPGKEGSAVVKNGERLLSANPLNVDKVMNNLAKIADNATTLTNGLADIVNKINEGKGSLGRLMNNDNLARKMENTIATANQTAASINVTSKTANEDMQAIKGSFLLRGYFKKKEKKRIKDSTERANKLIRSEKQKKEDVKKEDVKKEDRKKEDAKKDN
ncbi:MlaD family protein [Ferruginibacter sp.]|jgi:phospholipid/cholesterol/gamma-HCH transport system substrate-binding protein|uniref:MlaD family protein n=1 Tax=Ferruginibacter sp. TaxID=1940288 RepID=UPI00265A706A|nr:MlaD family protein [Ferruginibacter sp.]